MNQRSKRRRENKDPNGISDIVRHRRDPFLTKEHQRSNQENQLQVFTKGNLEDEHDTERYCPDCASSMFYFHKDQLFSCGKCGMKVSDANKEYEHIPAADLLLTEPTDKIGPSAAQDPEEDGSDFFFSSFSPDANVPDEDPNRIVTYRSVDNRIVHVRYKGFPPDLSAEANS